MSSFRYDFTLPANTLNSAPVSREIKLVRGTLTRVSIWFQAGCAGYVYARIKEGESLISPSDQLTGWSFDDYVLELQPEYDLINDPYILTLEGWSDGSIFSHTLITRWEVLTKEQRGIDDIYSLFVGLDNN